jgi:uncharacterized damage-inducible protein DinB
MQTFPTTKPGIAAGTQMKDMLQQLAMYDSWANQRLIECILQLPEEKTTEPVTSSFNSIQATLLHLWDAESIWWQRIKLQETVTPPSVNFKGTTRDIATAFLHQNKLWENWVTTASNTSLDHVFMYYTSKREPYKIPVSQMLMQMFNHNTYHRGQLVNMLRQSGVTKIPGTDFLIWTRRK